MSDETHDPHWNPPVDTTGGPGIRYITEASFGVSDKEKIAALRRELDKAIAELRCEFNKAIAELQLRVRELEWGNGRYD